MCIFVGALRSPLEVEYVTNKGAPSDGAILATAMSTNGGFDGVERAQKGVATRLEVTPSQSGQPRFTHQSTGRLKLPSEDGVQIPRRADLCT